MPNYRISRNGMLFICRREALVLTAYPDGPHPSIGFGHNNPKLKIGDTISPKQAFKLFKEDMTPREARLNSLIQVDLEQHEFDALMSLHYQSGNRFLVKHDKYPGPYIIDLLNNEGKQAAADALPECSTNLAGEHIEGLKKRRIMERTLFLTGDYGQLSPIPFWRGNPHTTKRGEYIVQDDDL